MLANRDSMTAPETPSHQTPDSSLQLEMLQPGSLWQRVRSQTRYALDCGALQPIETNCHYLEQAGVRFLVRILNNLSRKDKARKAQAKQSAQSGKDFNPFLPYETDLFVSNLSETHLCLLNKFNVVPYHLLVITRAYEEQETWLNLADFAALWHCMREVEGLAFYNSGAIAGASQRHKHLQLVPFPLDGQTMNPAVPIEPLIAQANLQEGVGTLPHFDFRHAIAPLGLPNDLSTAEAAEKLLACYQQLFDAAGIPSEQRSDRPTCAYNLLVTRAWMLLVPRSQECYGEISINSLGFAGALLVRNPIQLESVKQGGPFELLKQVSLNP